jgi:hypothetical protein
MRLAEDGKIEFTTSLGSIKGISAQSMAMICLALFAGFLVWQLSAEIATRLDKAIETQTKLVVVIEKLIDRLDRKFPAIP